MPNPNGWNEWSKHVLTELERLSKVCDDIRKQQERIRIDIATLKVKSGVWGAIAGLIPSGLVLIYILLRSN